MHVKRSAIFPIIPAWPEVLDLPRRICFAASADVVGEGEGAAPAKPSGVDGDVHEVVVAAAAADEEDDAAGPPSPCEARSLSTFW